MDGKNKPTVLQVVDSAIKPDIKKPKEKGGGSGGKGPGKVVTFGDYSTKDGKFHQIKTVRAGPDGGGTVEFPLCDFTCRIVEEVTADDGLTDAAFLRIEGRRCDGVPLPLVDVPAKLFFACQGIWANEYWGTLPLIYTGNAKKDSLRVCIQLYSRLNGDIPRRTVFRFTGWKKINDLWHYLTGSGAITAAGLVDGVQVDLGAGHMGLYTLPPPLAGDELIQAWNDARLLLGVCPNKPHIGAALLAAVARAPLGECKANNFAIWVHGVTGSMKSSLVAIVQSFFGNFQEGTFPANWSDSANDCEMKSHQIKDGVFTVDDFKPSVSRAEADKLYAMAERLIRNTGNQAGRGRRDANMQAKAAPFNRSLMLITAEDLPLGQSLLGRLLLLELNIFDVDLQGVLIPLQEAAKAERFTGLMSAYLQWLAPRLDMLKMDIPKIVEQYRNAALRAGFAASHPRAPEIYANLVAGAEIFLDFLEDVGAINRDEYNNLLGEIERNLQDAFREQGAYQTEQDEIERFLELLRSVLSSGDAYISSKHKQGPPMEGKEFHLPFLYGWKSSVSDDSDSNSYSPCGECVGWYSEAGTGGPAEVWLIPDTAFKVAQEVARKQGAPILMTASTLWRRMQEKKLLLKTEPDKQTNKPRTTVHRKVVGGGRRVLVIAAELIESSSTKN